MLKKIVLCITSFSINVFKDVPSDFKKKPMSIAQGLLRAVRSQNQHILQKYT